MAAGETDADLRELMKLEGTPAELAGTSVLGIFEEPLTVDPLGGLGVAAGRPQYRMPSSDVPANVTDAPLQLLYRGVLRRFAVREHEPDGTGLTVLKLSEAA